MDGVQFEHYRRLFGVERYFDTHGGSTARSTVNVHALAIAVKNSQPFTGCIQTQPMPGIPFRIGREPRTVVCHIDMQVAVPKE